LREEQNYYIKHLNNRSLNACPMADNPRRKLHKMRQEERNGNKTVAGRLLITHFKKCKEAAVVVSNFDY
jgi:hypothetical protein